MVGEWIQLGSFAALLGILVSIVGTAYRLGGTLGEIKRSVEHIDQKTGNLKDRINRLETALIEDDNN